MEQPEREHEIRRVDPTYRRRVAIAAVVAAGIGFGVLWLIRGQMNHIDALAEENMAAATERAMDLVAAVAWAGGLGTVGTGLWFWYLGWKVRRSGEFPPPGWKVIKDTPVRRGRRAAALATVVQGASALLAVVGAVGMWYFYRVAEVLLRQ